jgi:DnaK suppressor protein
MPALRAGAYCCVTDRYPEETVLKKTTNKKELERYKALLLKQKETLLEQIDHISKDTLKQSQKDAAGDISGYTYHMADVATDNYDREFSLGLATSDRQALYEIDYALKRIDEGTFGVCGDCSKIINKKRLTAVPYARLCLQCQQSREKK